ncbi:MAG: CheR family methyltransferase [Planctomycetota bacterium]|jgi:chemotaxis protein methyltransferase CheR
MTFTMIEGDLSDKDFERFRALVYEHSRIHLGDHKRTLMRTRFSKVMRGLGLSTFQDYYRYIVEDTSGQAISEMLNAISTNLTHFFRESKHFEYLSSTYLPELISRCSAEKRTRIRAWSAGSSSGEEAYSIAIILKEALPPDRHWDVKILATDIDSNMLEHGRRGLYAAKQLKDMPPLLKQKYCIQAGAREAREYQVVPALKQVVAFRRLNLMESPWPFHGPFDFIFCRNVMIYFDRPTQEALVNRYHQVLAPGAPLFIGHSESLSSITHPFRYVMPTIYQR